MPKSNLIPTVDSLPPKINKIHLSEVDFYTRKNFALVNEKVLNNDLGEEISVNIDFLDKSLTNYVELISNLALEIDDISDQFTGITSESYGDSVSGITTFSLKSNNFPLFKCEINDENITSDTSEDLSVFKVNHDFSTGEEVAYEYDSTPIQIQSTNIVGVGTTTILPSKVYVYKESSSVFKISKSQEDALAGLALTFSSVGSGTTHYFYSKNANTRSIIIIDGIIQSPLSRKKDTVGLGTTSVGVSTTVIPISGISSLTTSDFILLGDEYLQITGISTSNSTATVIRGSMGSVAVDHTSGDSIKIYEGNYYINKDKIYFSSPPSQESSFDGRVFYKKLYDKNIIFDDISKGFTGVGKTFNMTSELSNVGLVTSNTTGNQYGIVLVNNVFQRPGIDYDLSSTVGVTTLTFTGSAVEDLPKSGKILSYNFYSGSGYQPAVSAAATVSVGSGGTISAVYLSGNGSGYLTAPRVSIYSTVGSGATITALVGTGSSVGFVTGFIISNPGSGYTTSNLPLIVVDEPYGYTSLPLQYYSGVGVGTGASIDLTIGVGGTVSSFRLSNVGVGYSSGDILSVSGIGTVSGHTPLTLTVTETQKDKFDFWTFGKLLRIKVEQSPNGKRRIFSLLNFENNLPINFKTNSIDTRFDLRKNFLVFINDVLQDPSNYSFFGNNLILVEPPIVQSKIHVYLYVASDDDSNDILVEESVKAGDFIRLENQDQRTILKILSRTVVRTPNYYSSGISSSLEDLRVLDWTKQTRDLKINGITYYKSRNSYSPLIRPSSRLIAGIGSTSQSIYVENSHLFDVDDIPEQETSVEIFNDISLLRAEAEAVVSAAGTVSSITVTNGGSGYSQLKPPNVVITDKQILKSTIGKTWNLVDSSSSTFYNKTLESDNIIVSVGNSLSLRTSYNLINFYTNTVGVGSTNLNSISFGNDLWVTVGNNGFISTSTNLTSWNPVGVATIVSNIIPEQISNISFTNNFNDVAYSNVDGRFAIISDGGKVFSYDVLDPVLVQRYQNKIILRDSTTTQDLNSIIVDNVFDIGEGVTKTQYVAVGNSATIIVSSNSINNNIVGTPGVVWQTRMSDAVSPTGLSGNNLNDIVHTGISTLPFIVVGDNGLVVKFPNNRFDPGNFTIVPSFTTDNLKSIIYDSENERAIVVGLSGTAYGSYRSSSFNTWEKLQIGSANLNDIIYSTSNQKYFVVGDGKSYTSSYQKVGAAATAIVSVAGTITSISITDGGVFYDTSAANKPSVIISSPPLSKERFNSCKVKGDYGVIVGVSTTSGISTSSPAIKFEIEVDPVLSLSESQIETGDYFVTYRTNIGSGVTSIENTGTIVGIATTFIDCVFKASQVVKSGSGIVTITSNVSSISGLTSIPTNYEYGIYSWGKIYDFDGRKTPVTYSAKTLNGSLGLSTSPKVVRLTSIGSTVLPRNV